MQYYAKSMTEAEMAEATAAMTWLQEPSSSGLSAGAIAGIAVGAAAAAVLAVAAALFVVRRRRRRPVLDAEAAMRAIKVRTLADQCSFGWWSAAVQAAALRLESMPPSHLAACQHHPSSSPLACTLSPMKQNDEQPGSLSCSDVTSMRTGGAFSNPKASSSTAPSSLLTSNGSRTSTEQLALDLGKEWLVDVSQASARVH